MREVTYIQNHFIIQELTQMSNRKRNYLSIGKHQFSGNPDNKNEGLRKQELLTTTAEKVGQFRQTFLEEKGSQGIWNFLLSPHSSLFENDTFGNHRSIH